MTGIKEEIIRIREDSYILATSPRIDDRTRVLKHGDTFAVFDRFGDIEPIGTGELGLYHKDTRFLSRLSLRIENTRPLLLSSSIRDDNAILAVDAMNSDIRRDGVVVIPHGTVHIFRSKVLWSDSCHERIRFHNYGTTEITLPITLEFHADFVDIFEVRGARRTRSGERFPVQFRGDTVLFGYLGLDGRMRTTRITMDPAPAKLTESVAAFELRLPPRAEQEFQLVITCWVDGTPRPREDVRLEIGPPIPVRRYHEAAQQATSALIHGRNAGPLIYTSNEQFNDWLNRSLADLHLMRTETGHGSYPYAGVPWFCTAFGRDGLITARECLSFDPVVARGVLNYLASRQADRDDPDKDAQPGKILHETRSGEMATLGEVPFENYYGSIDSTPLFVMLAGAYYERTADLAFIRSLWSNIERALEWIDQYGDIDGDGFVEYAPRGEKSLIQQGWKDSNDSVFHADGRLAKAPIALCEVQGYVYAAKQAAAVIARALGEASRAEALMDQARRLKHQFEEAFWCEDLSTYAIALDGDKRPCRVRTSNAGHCLFAGIVEPSRAIRVAATLTGEALSSGWGIRTVAAGEARYNPMSYHNGSIWPHDNALIAAGFARYGLNEQAAGILTALLDASLFFDLHRLPELFCGFPRRPGEAPTLYPVACAPQTWASGAIFLLLESCLGLKVNAIERRVVFTKPYLPQCLARISIRGLKVGEAQLDLLITRHDVGDVGVNVLARKGNVDVMVHK